MNKIKNIKAREILDSRGVPTLEVQVILNSNIKGTFSVPSGASTGIYEAYELRDKDVNRYNGKGVLKAKENVNTIINDALKGMDVFNQKEIDEKLIKLDGTDNKEKLGANAILGVSLAVARAAAKASNKELYEYLSETHKVNLVTPMMNVINGGVHAINSLDIQEFMIVPVSSTTTSEAIHMSANVFNALRKTLKEFSTSSLGYGDEGGFAPNLENDEQALKVLVKAISEAGYIPGKDIKLAIDAASSEWYENETGTYYLPKSKKRLTREELVDMWEYFVNTYPIVSIEDAMGEIDIEGWKMLTDRLSNKIMLVGDDLFVTNPKRLKMGIENNIANAILIKVNQIGTLSETLKTIKMAQEANYDVIISHRSGETNDDFISDLAIATNAKYIKAGAPNRGERVAKYNRLLAIEEDK